jgi:3'-phosphoadenosine 5'-phosphosulfate sulfotransferase (PAPS reductase)/FAD synthetase
MRTIVALSGGLASAWCANYAIEKWGREKVVLYFNDTKWEDQDLYRFLEDLEDYFKVKIVKDSDGRNPEEVFNEEHLMGNSRIAICSRILKAQRLQQFYQNGDVLAFGIDKTEEHRAVRIRQVYADVAIKKKKDCTLVFPLINENIEKWKVRDWLNSTGIRQPRLYDLGFAHNNCAGGCVRAGKKHWNHLLKNLPEVYADRERMETEFRFSYPNATILKNETLEDFRIRMTETVVQPDLWTEEDKAVVECVGICDLVS